MIIKIITAALITILFFPAGVLMAQEKPPIKSPPEDRSVHTWIPAPGNVVIYSNGVSMPLGRFLLIRKGKDCLAIKFIATWLGKEKDQHYTSYEYYYQDDGSGDFARENVKSGKDAFYFPGLKSFLMMFPTYKEGVKNRIRYAEINTVWRHPTWVDFKHGYFSKVELAPTTWSSIEDVNINDPRIRWYSQGDGHERMEVPIDSLWKDAASGKEDGKK